MEDFAGISTRTLAILCTSRYSLPVMSKSASAAARPKSGARGGTEVVSAGSPSAARLERLGRTITELNLAFLLVTNPKDVGYLTGFIGGDSYLLVPALTHQSPRAVVISDFRYKEELESLGLSCDLHIREMSMSDAVAGILADRAKGCEDGELGRVGIQAEQMTVGEKATIARKLTGVLGNGAGKKLTDTMNLVPKLRLIKDEHELTLIRKAAKIQQDALMSVLPTIKPGQTEAEVAAAIESEMKRRGASEVGFQTIVASGASSSLPHYRPQQKKLAASKVVLIDWGAVFQGYHADMTRVFAFGKWPAKMAEIYKVVLDAHQLAAQALAPGMNSKQIDLVARKHIAAAGYADFFGHGLGHGLGLNAHEDPRLTNTLAGSKLEPGMVVTIEPGIYLPGEGGVRIEDDYAITETGAVNLCSMKKDLDWATL